MLTYIQTHIDELIAIFTGIVTVASMIAALTPSPADDSFVAKIRKLVDLLALNVGNAKPEKKED